MAHEIAAAMTAAAAETEPGPATERARTLILDLGRHRSHWPHGWPSKKAARRLAAPAPDGPPWRRPAEGTESAWLDAAGTLSAIAAQELRVVVQVGLLEAGVDEHEQALEAAVDDDALDIQSLWLLVDLHDQAVGGAERADAQDPQAIRELPARELADLAERRRAVIETLAAADPAAPTPEQGRRVATGISAIRAR